MHHPDNKPLFSAIEPLQGPNRTDCCESEGRSLPVRTDRLYQIAAVTAGLFLLATAL